MSQISAALFTRSVYDKTAFSVSLSGSPVLTAALLAPYAYKNYKVNQEIKKETGDTAYLPTIAGTALGDIVGGIGGALGGAALGAAGGGLVGGIPGALAAAVPAAVVGGIGGGYAGGFYGANKAKEWVLNNR